MKRIIFVLGLLFAASMAWGQITIPPGAVINNNAAAGGACNMAGPAQFNVTTQTLFSCPSGTLVVVAGGSTFQALTCTNVSADQTILQAALTASRLGTGPALIVVSGVCSLPTPPLIIGSNTTLQGSQTGASLNVTSGTNPTAIENYANSVSQRTSAGASMTASSATLILTDSSGTTADIGRTVYIPNGLASGQGLWSIVTAFTDSNHETVADKALFTTGSVAAVYYNRDSNITMRGITINLSTSNQFNSVFRHIDGLLVEDMSFSSSGGNPFAILIGDATNFKVIRPNGLGTAADLVHVHGPAAHGLIDRAYCNPCHSDTVSLTTVDYPTWAVTWGNIDDVTIQNTDTEGASSGQILLLGGANTKFGSVRVLNTHSNSTAATSAVAVAPQSASSLFPGPTVIQSLTIDGVYANVPVKIAPATGYSVAIRNVIPVANSLSSGYCPVSIGIGETDNVNQTMGVVDISNVSIGSNLTGWNQDVCVIGQSGYTTSVSTLAVHNSQSGASVSGSNYSGILQVGATGVTTSINTLNLFGNVAPWTEASQTEVAYNFSGGTNTVTNLNISGDMLTDASNVALVGLSIAASSTVTNLQWSNPTFNCNASQVNGGLIDVSGTLSHYSISSPNISYCGNIVRLETSAAAANGEITGGVLSGTTRVGNWLNTQTETVSLGNMNIVSASAAIYVSNATLSIFGAGLNTGGSWAGLQRAGTETVYSYNQSFRVDVALLTATAGQFAYNTNASSAAIGPVAYNGSSWQLGGTVDCTNPSNFCFLEDFPTNTTAGGSIGTNGWSIQQVGGGAAGTVAAQNGAWPHMGIIDLTSGATASDGIELTQNAGGKGITGSGIWANVPWTLTASFQLQQTTTTRFFIGFGVTGNTAVKPVSGCWVRFDSTVPDTNFIDECGLTSTYTTADSGIAADTGWHKITISSTTAGTIKFQVDSGTVQSISAHVPTGASMQTDMIMATDGSATSVQVYVDYYNLIATGLSR